MLLVIISGVLLYGLFLIWAINQGMLEKFGPEYIPIELGIQFNHHRPISEDEAKISYNLSEIEKQKVFGAIQDQFNTESKFPYGSLQNHKWEKFAEQESRFIDTLSRDLKAVFSMNSGQLIYYKK